MKNTLFWIVVICEILLGAALVLTLAVPRLRYSFASSVRVHSISAAMP